MYKKISDYSIIGNLHSVALIGLDGSMDWLCLPHIDSPSVFGALLDDQKGGRFAVSPAQDWDSTARYVEDTQVIVTRFRTRTGEMLLTDFMSVPFGGEEHMEEEHHDLYRLVEITRGTVEVSMVFHPRFDYARARTTLEKRGESVVAKGNGQTMILQSNHTLECSENGCSARWHLSGGDRLWLYLRYGEEEPRDILAEQAERCLEETVHFWRNWLKRSETGRSVDLDPFVPMVNRSALTLKLLYYDPTGTIAAAATTSLPEKIGGVRNWDYRYTWLRDASLTLQALFHLGHLSETEGYLRFIEGLVSRHGAEKLQVMYGLRGEPDLREEELTHLDGYKGSRPVRIGNGAATQKQLDIYGELMDAALKLSDYVGKISTGVWPYLRDICDYVVEHWQEKDSGIWEVRAGPHHFVYSKVMCWVALDRGITIARRYGFPADLEKWKKTKHVIRDEVLQKGWSEKKKAFVQHYETDALDSSSLLIPAVGFLPYRDPRVLSTVDAIRRELEQEGFLYRYKSEDGLPGEEGFFLVCTFWLIDNLVAQGKIEEAETLLRRAESTANHAGLFAEEYDFEWSEPLGNFPQAFTHIGYINTVVSLCKSKRKTVQVEKAVPPSILLADKIILNEGEPRKDIAVREIAPRLKTAMNILRGAFFDTTRGRVAYELMKDSPAYREYVEISCTLKNMDLKTLKHRQEKLAFWINLYNVIVVHGVIELGVRDSVKEVRNFFDRIMYRIGEEGFSPDDIEHGILRGNKRPPGFLSLFPRFRGKDERLQHVIDPMDPRIHFALVCASSSCPPIELYTPENIDEELTVAGQVFLNSGGVRIDEERRRVSLSRIFKWYASDFGEDPAARLRLIAPYLYRSEDSALLRENAETLAIDYQDYDWRLNRY